MTGLAAVRAGRRAEMSDISALGQHIAQGYLTRTPHTALREAAQGVMAYARDALGDLYATTRASDGALCEMVRTVWSFTYVCPECCSPLVYFQHISPTGSPPPACPRCKHAFTKRLWGRADDAPVQVIVHGQAGKLTEQLVAPADFARIARALADERQSRIPSQNIDEQREMYSRSGLGKAGLRATKDFFSSRNSIALYELWTAINAVKDAGLRQKLRFCFTHAMLPKK